MTAVIGIALGTQVLIATAGAQAPLPGDRVRLTLAPGDGSRVTGTLLEVRGDTMVLKRGDATTAPTLFPANQVHSIERSVGTRTRGMKGATIGAVVGATLGAVLGYAGGDSGPECPSGSDLFCQFVGYERLFDRSTTAVWGAGIGLTAGFAIGGLIGLASPTDRWQLLTAPDHPVKLSIRPAGPAGPRAVFSFAFGGATTR